MLSPCFTFTSTNNPTPDPTMSTPTDPTHDQPELPAEVREAIVHAYAQWWGAAPDGTAHSNVIDFICAALAPLWPKQPQPSADVEKLAEECVRKCFEAELSYKEQVFLDRKKNEVSAIIARAFAEKDAEIARLKDKHKQSPEYLSMLQAMLDMKARAERAERAEAELTGAKDHIAIATHPELGWAVSEEEHSRVVAECTRLRAEVERLSAPRSTMRSPADIKEIADLRAQLNELQRINQADYTEAGWQRARELEAQLTALEASERKAHYEREDARQALELCRTELAAAQEDKERLDWLTESRRTLSEYDQRWEIEGNDNSHNSPRAAIDQARAHQ